MVRQPRPEIQRVYPQGTAACAMCGEPMLVERLTADCNVCEPCEKDLQSKLEYDQEFEQAYQEMRLQRYEQSVQEREEWRQQQRAKRAAEEEVRRERSER